MGIFRAEVGGRDRLGSRGRGSGPEEPRAACGLTRTRQRSACFLSFFFLMEQQFFISPPAPNRGEGGVGWSNGFGVRKAGFRFCSWGN